MTNVTGNLIKQKKNGQDWYEIEVEGHFNRRWFDWLDGWEITILKNGNTLLYGPIIDQPALHGIFAGIRDLNLKIISLKNVRLRKLMKHKGWKNEKSKIKP